MLCTLTYNTFSVILFLSLLAPTLCACCVINPGKWHLSACFTKKIKSLASVKSRRMFTSYCSVLLFTPSHTASNSVFMEIALCLWLMLLQKRFVFPSHKEQWTAFVLYIVFTVQLCRLNHSPNLLSLSLVFPSNSLSSFNLCTCQDVDTSSCWSEGYNQEGAAADFHGACLYETMSSLHSNHE